MATTQWSGQQWEWNENGIKGREDYLIKNCLPNRAIIICTQGNQELKIWKSENPIECSPERCAKSTSGTRLICSYPDKNVFALIARSYPYVWWQTTSIKRNVDDGISLRNIRVNDYIKYNCGTGKPTYAPSTNMWRNSHIFHFLSILFRKKKKEILLCLMCYSSVLTTDAIFFLSPFHFVSISRLFIFSFVP